MKRITKHSTDVGFMGGLEYYAARSGKRDYLVAYLGDEVSEIAACGRRRLLGLAGILNAQRASQDHSR